MVKVKTIRNKNSIRKRKQPRKLVQNTLEKLNTKRVNAKKVFYEGIQFQSGLEKSMYVFFINNGFEINKTFFYENDKAILVDTFKCANEIWVNSPIKKSFVKLRDTVRSMTYKPDFSSHPKLKDCTWIVETKGRMSDSFPLRFKLFKQWLVNNNPSCKVYLPSNKTECEFTINEILKIEK
jgi:hypothetical protein